METVQRNVTKTTDLTTEDAHTFAHTDPAQGKELCEALGAPPQTREVHIHIGVDDLVRITYEAIMSREQLRAVAELLSKEQE